MVAHRVRARLTVCLHAADVPMHRAAERTQQQSERTVEAVAVAAPASERNPPCRLYRIDRPPPAGIHNVSYGTRSAWRCTTKVNMSTDGGPARPGDRGRGRHSDAHWYRPCRA